MTPTVDLELCIRVSLKIIDEQRRIVAYLDGLQAKVNALRDLKCQTQEELDALLPSVLDRAFKGGSDEQG